MPARVLVADDSLNIQRTVAHILKEAGIDAVTVGNGEHAVRRLADIKPDLILADVFMPVRSGFEVCEYVKNSEHFSHVPVLLLASTMEPYDEKEAQRVHADGRLTKPFKDPSATLATIQEWLAKAANAHPAAPPAPEPVATAPPPAEPEPLPELYATRPPHVTFGPGEAPLGFSDLLEEPAAEPSPPAAPSTDETVFSGKGFVRSEPVEADEVTATPVSEPFAPPPPLSPPEPPVQPESWAGEEGELELVSESDSELPPAALIPEVEPEAPPTIEREEEERERPPVYEIEKPELAAPWEMTGPPPGAPEIRVPDWDSQWKSSSDLEAPAAGTPAEPAPGAEMPDFAAALAAAQRAAAEAVAQSAPAGQAVDPAVVESVVKEVMERLSPQVVDHITREIIRPLAEALLKQKLDQQ